MRGVRSLRHLPPAAALQVLSLAGCIGFGEGSPALKSANESAALSVLRKYSTAQAMLLAEENRYAHSLEELYGGGRFGGLIRRGLLDAWHRDPSPVPLNGYLFSDIERDASGGRLTDPWRCGLAAYPARPGITGDRVLLILMDEGWNAPEGPVSHGSWRLFWAGHEQARGPVTRWPAREEFGTTYREIRRRSPEEGLREAEQVLEDHRSGRPVRDPVFGEGVTAGSR